MKPCTNQEATLHQLVSKVEQSELTLTPPRVMIDHFCWVSELHQTPKVPGVCEG